MRGISIYIAANVESHRIPEWERALTKGLMVKIRVNHNYGAAQGFGIAVGTSVTGGPPHRSVREELPHTAPALSRA